MSSPATYAKAGVNIDEGNRLVSLIKPLARATARAGCMSDLGGFGALFDVKGAGFNDPVLVATTDGVGTKLKIAQITGKHDTVGIDLVAMCVNDLVVQGAEPLFFLDYFATGELRPEIGAEVVKGIAEGCKQAGCALIGGETAEMPGMYPPGEYDLAGFAVGAVERGAMLPRANVQAGDVILGLASSGLHSNGFSLVRHLVTKSSFWFDKAAPFDAKRSLGEALLEPTRIYVKSCLSALRATGEAIKAFAHITGGGLLENIPRVIPDTLAAEINLASFALPPVISWLKAEGNIEPRELARTFNCGIGMMVVVAPAQADAVKKSFEASGETIYTIGMIVPRGSEPVMLNGSWKA